MSGTSENFIRQVQKVEHNLKELVRVLEPHRKASPLAEKAYKLVEDAQAQLAKSLQDTASFYPCVNVASERLAQALELFHKPEFKPSAKEIAEFVARSLAMLYPIKQSVKPSMRPRKISQGNPPKPVQDERRQAQRFAMQTDISFESDTNFYSGFTEDLSDGGLFVSTYALKKIGEKIDLSFTLPNGHVVNCVGTVRWVRDPRDNDPDTTPGFGVQFENLTAEDKQAILSFTKARSPLFYDE